MFVILSLLLLLALGCAECEGDYECEGTLICQAGRCQPLKCRRHEDCAPGRICKENSCEELSPQGAPTPDALILGPRD